MVDYFKKFFDMVTPNMHRAAEMLMGTALATFIRYNDGVPSQIVNMLLASFDVDEEPQEVRDFASSICRDAADELQAYFAHHIAEKFQPAMERSSEDDENELASAHRLVLQIHKSAPALLRTFIPQLEEHLSSPKTTPRLYAVETLGIILSDNPSIRHPSSTWKAWLRRSCDKVSAIRVAWIKSSRSILLQHTEGREDLIRLLVDRSLDTDDKVRLEAIDFVASLDSVTWKSIDLAALLTMVRDRCRDKKYSIQSEALRTLGLFYDRAYPDLRDHDCHAIKTFSWIPNALLQAFPAATSNSHNILIDVRQVFKQYIVPLPDQSPSAGQEWEMRLTTTLSFIDIQNLNAFARVCNLTSSQARYAAFLDICRQIMSQGLTDQLDTTLHQSVDRIASHFPDPVKATRDLKSFAMDGDSQTVELLETIMDDQTDVDTYAKSLSSALQHVATLRSSSTMRMFTHLSGFPILNNSSFGHMLEEISGEELHQDDERIRRLVYIAAKLHPQMFLLHAPNLLAKLHSSSLRPQTKALNLYILAKIEHGNDDEGRVVYDTDDTDVIGSIACQGTYDEARFAAKLLSVIAANSNHTSSQQAYKVIVKLGRELMQSVLTFRSDRLGSDIAALTQIVKKFDIIDAPDVSKILDKYLRYCMESTAEQESSANVWGEAGALAEPYLALLVTLHFIRAYLIRAAAPNDSQDILQTCVQHLLTHATNDQSSAKLIHDDGLRARLRLESAVQLLKLACQPDCDKRLGGGIFRCLSNTVQDESFEVRQSFLRHLLSHCTRRSSHLPARYYALSFLAAHDPEDELRDLVRTSYGSLTGVMTSALRLRYLDMALARFLHILTGHPDFQHTLFDNNLTLDILKEVAKYLNFALDCISSPQNIACLYHIAHRCRGVRIVMGEESSSTLSTNQSPTTRFHIFCELAMRLIHARSEKIQVDVTRYDGQVSLPRDLFMPYRTREEQSTSLQQSYIDDSTFNSILQYLKRESRAHKSTKKGHQTNRSNHRAKNSTRIPKRKRHADQDTESELSDIESASSSAVSEDESLGSSFDEKHHAALGGGQRIRQRQRLAKQERNKNRQSRRNAKVRQHTNEQE